MTTLYDDQIYSEGTGQAYILKDYGRPYENLGTYMKSNERRPPSSLVKGRTAEMIAKELDWLVSEAADYRRDAWDDVDRRVSKMAQWLADLVERARWEGTSDTAPRVKAEVDRIVAELVGEKMDAAMKAEFERRQHKLAEMEIRLIKREGEAYAKEQSLIDKEAAASAAVDKHMLRVQDMRVEEDRLKDIAKDARVRIETDRALHQKRLDELKASLARVAALEKEWGRIISESEVLVDDGLMEYFERTG